MNHPHFGVWIPLPSGKLSHKTMEKITMFNGKTHYKWAIFHSYVSLPEGMFGRISTPPQQLKFLSASTFPRKITKKKHLHRKPSFWGPAIFPCYLPSSVARGEGEAPKKNIIKCRGPQFLVDGSHHKDAQLCIFAMMLSLSVNLMG